VQRVRERFGLAQVVMVGDRGMVSQKAIDDLRGQGGIDWITALKSVSIRGLVEQGHLQLGLFDQRNLAEITSPDYPGERLVACRNDALAKLRAHKRESLLQATEALLALIKASVDAGRLTGQDKIGVQVGKIINRHKVAKHFELNIGEAALAWSRRQDAIDAEAALDGLYVIRTSLSEQRMDAPTCVRSYKALANVERAFRSLKTVDLKVRPIHHRLADRVRAHILLCMLACYVEWHMREAWAPLMFADTDQAAKATRDPVAPARRSASAQRKAASKLLDDEQPVHSFATLMAQMATLVRNTCRTPSAGADAPTFELLTTANAHQQRALALIQAIHP
jgi:transposase